MRKLVVLTAFSAVVAAALAAQPARFTGSVPCEDMLSDLRAAVEAARLSDADAAKVKDLEDKGIERCNADDDKRADEFFAQAMQILGK